MFDEKANVQPSRNLAEDRLGLYGGAFDPQPASPRAPTIGKQFDPKDLTQTEVT